MRPVVAHFLRPLKVTRLVVCISVLGLSSLPVLGQPKAAFTGEFPLAPGDVLTVNVADHPEMTGNLPVTESGQILIPTIGNLTVSGKTVAQAEKQIIAAIRTELNNPQVSVTLLRSKPRQVLIVGAVKASGPLDLGPAWRVSEAIDGAGGLTAEADDLVATLVRDKGQPQTLNLTRIMASPQDPANVAVKPGDILKFSLLPGRTVTVAGDVKSPSSVLLRRGNRLLDALVATGGLLQKPETTKITLIRSGRETNIDAVKAFSQRDSAANAPLINGDLVMVQAIHTSISVVSLHDEVKNSGNLNLEGEAHVLQAVLAAGLTVPPDQVELSIRRGATKIPVDLERASYDPAFDLPLKDGDVLLVTPPNGPEVRIAGGITKPGPLNLAKDATLLDAILASGGLTGKPDEVRLSILRRNAERQTVLNVDPVALISLRDLGQNVRLQDGDLIMVNPVQTRTVFISGEVGQPGAFQMGENDGLVELLLRAGGGTPFAELSQVQVLHRDNTAVTVNLSQATQPGANRVPIALEAGDLVTVPRNTRQVLVMNAVQKPGYYPIPENGVLTIGDALLLAGGPKDRARLQDVALVRRNPDGTLNRKIVPVNELATGPVSSGQLSIAVPLQPGDIVYVPEGKTSTSGLTTALSAVSGLGVLRTLFGN